MEKKKRKKEVNMRLLAPSDVHRLIIKHKVFLEDSSEYEVSLEEAHIDLLRKSKSHPELQHLK